VTQLIGESRAAGGGRAGRRRGGGGVQVHIVALVAQRVEGALDEAELLRRADAVLAVRRGRGVHVGVPLLGLLQVRLADLLHRRACIERLFSSVLPLGGLAWRGADSDGQHHRNRTLILVLRSEVENPWGLSYYLPRGTPSTVHGSWFTCSLLLSPLTDIPRPRAVQTALGRDTKDLADALDLRKVHDTSQIARPVRFILPASGFLP